MKLISGNASWTPHRPTDHTVVATITIPGKPNGYINIRVMLRVWMYFTKRFLISIQIK